MDAKKAGSSLDSLIFSFNTRIAEPQELVIARNMYPISSVADLSAVDAAVKAMELQVQAIKDRLREETEAIPKAKKILQNMSSHASPYLPQKMTTFGLDTTRCLLPEASKQLPDSGLLKPEEPAVVPKEKKGHGPPPLWYITSDELDSLSSYMRGRLTLEKVNAAINDMAKYAETAIQLISAPKKKLAQNLWERALGLVFWC